MAQFKDLKMSQEIARYILGSTEGMFYTDIFTKKPVDLRYTATVSTGKSGMSFGLAQLDLGQTGNKANNRSAQILYAELLRDARNAGLISSSEEKDFYYKATKSPLSLTKSELNKISRAVLGTPSARPKIDKADAVQIRKTAQYTVDLIDAVRKAWGTAGVFDENDPDHLKAVGHVISWVNRTHKPTAMTNFLVGNNQTVNKGKILRIRKPPTLGDVENYLLNNEQFVKNPQEFPNVNDNINRGIDSLRRLQPQKHWKFGKLHNERTMSAFA